MLDENSDSFTASLGKVDETRKRLFFSSSFGTQMYSTYYYKSAGGFQSYSIAAFFFSSG
jgi:hypothetical protein